MCETFIALRNEYEQKKPVYVNNSKSASDFSNKPIAINTFLYTCEPVFLRKGGKRGGVGCHAILSNQSLHWFGHSSWPISIDRAGLISSRRTRVGWVAIDERCSTISRFSFGSVNCERRVREASEHRLAWRRNRHRDAPSIFNRVISRSRVKRSMFTSEWNSSTSLNVASCLKRKRAVTDSEGMALRSQRQSYSDTELRHRWLLRRDRWRFDKEFR